MAEEHSSRGARRRWLVDISRWNPTAEQFQAAVAVLPAHHGPDIARFVKDDDRKRALVSRLLQYSLVHQVLGIPFCQINICRTIEGKPYLQNKSVAFQNFSFNTSHQGDYVGIASELLCLVGLDIVCISKPTGETTMEFVRNFSSYLTLHEWNCIVCAGNSIEMLTEFYRSTFTTQKSPNAMVFSNPFNCMGLAIYLLPFYDNTSLVLPTMYWCLKEAFVKAIGAGVGFGLHRLEFHHVHGTNIAMSIDGVESRNWRFWLFKLDEVHLASIAKGHPEDAINSYKKTLSSMVVKEEELHAAVEIPEEPFTLLTVEQLTQFQE